MNLYDTEATSEALFAVNSGPGTSAALEAAGDIGKYQEALKPISEALEAVESVSQAR